MILKNVQFKAFRSLINSELQFEHSCMGLVGINESGKTNVLLGLAVLAGKHNLSKVDSPKLKKSLEPHVSFEFTLSNHESKNIHTANQLEGTLPEKLWPEELKVTYEVKYDKSKEEEIRYFKLNNLISEEGVQYCSDLDAITGLAGYLGLGLDGTECLTESDLFVLSDSSIEKLEKRIEASKKVSELEESIDLLNQQIAAIQDDQSPTEDKEDAEDTEDTEDAEDAEDAEEVLAKVKAMKTGELKELSGNLENQQFELDKARAIAEECVYWQRYQESLTELNYLEEKSILNSVSKLDDLTNRIEVSEKSIEALPEVLSTIQVAEKESAEAELTKLKKDYRVARGQLTKFKTKAREEKRNIDLLEQEFSDIYDADIETLNVTVGKIVSSDLDKLLPHVVRWEHAERYILPGEIDYEEILACESEDDLSRPLMNLFRIGCGAQNLEKVHDVVNEVAGDSGERSRVTTAMNEKLSSYIKTVWPKYDQRIKVSLESEKLLVQVYDPECQGASYFEMNERSQGCQTFLSFLFTIAAEARCGVITNTLLLLDEPETHLHPSGVRHMLAQLIEAGEKGNSVVYATHSLFMIDRNNFDRHVVVEKTKELTNLKPSLRKRIGYFMHEEVLYGALQVDTTTEFSSATQYNFVFEGLGDAILFEKYMRECHCKNNDTLIKLDQAFFHHGGKCSDMENHFRNTTLPMRTKWIFVLDKDKPAQKLSNSLKRVYKSYLNRDVFICHYESDQEKPAVIAHDTDLDIATELELEDLLPSEIIESTIDKIHVIHSENIPQDVLNLGSKIGMIKFFEEIEASNVSESVYGTIKSSFKEELNSAIETLTAGINSQTEFESKFSIYEQWAKRSAEYIETCLKELA